MVRGLERPNDWVLEVNAFCYRIISLYSHVGMARGKIWRSAFFGSAWDGTREARLNFFWRFHDDSFWIFLFLLIPM